MDTLVVIVDPWSVEKLTNCAFTVDTLDTFDVIVDVTNVDVKTELVAITLTALIFVVPMVDPWSEEKLINWAFKVDTLDTLVFNVDVISVEVDNEVRDTIEFAVKAPSKVLE